MQPLRVMSGVPLMAVVRLESNSVPLPDAGAVSHDILTLAGERPDALQVDFDARLSEREWYRRLLGSLRREMKASTPLTITALASWCDRDDWLEGLPIDDAVPMLFRMGAGEPRETVSRKPTGSAKCRTFRSL